MVKWSCSYSLHGFHIQVKRDCVYCKLRFRVCILQTQPIGKLLCYVCVHSLLHASQDPLRSVWCHGRSLETWETIEVRVAYWCYLVKWCVINMFVYGCIVFSATYNCVLTFTNNFSWYCIICGKIANGFGICHDTVVPTGATLFDDTIWPEGTNRGRQSLPEFSNLEGDTYLHDTLLSIWIPQRTQYQLQIQHHHFKA